MFQCVGSYILMTPWTSLTNLPHTSFVRNLRLRARWIMHMTEIGVPLVQAVVYTSDVHKSATETIQKVRSCG